MAEISIEKINGLALSSAAELVNAEEKRYKDFTDGIADRVAKSENIKIVLLAGPSGSGKTTTANLLADDIRARGLDCHVISLDDFYRDSTDPAYPVLENGDRDFESVDALNIPELEKTLLDISAGKEFFVPHYDFKIGGRTELRKYDKISHGCVVIEGLHALNPRISEHLPAEKLFRIFISVSTNINKDGERILSGRKLRFARRMIRDSVYRGADAERTLSLWTNVLDGEDKNLYPYRHLADIDFNTFHAFEPGVMKSYVKELISPELAKKNDYAATVLYGISEAASIEEDLVPADSLIREFITGGIYEEFY